MQIITNDIKEAIKNRLTQDKGLQVFQYYGFEPNNRKPQRENPFRQERTSSFFVNWYSNAFRFKDFGDTDIKGNAWDFVKRYHNLTDSADVWRVLADIYGIWGTEHETIGGKRKTDYPKLQNSKHTTPQNDKATLVSITFRDFSPEELDFWWKKGEIDLPTLQTNQVKAVASFKIQYEKEGGKTTLYEKKNIRFVFAFEIVANKCYKLYQPKEMYRAFGKGKTSFLPNLTPAKEAFGENYRYALGLDMLEVGGSAILCGGEADYLALKAKGYNAFTMGSEEAKIPAFVLEKLQASNITPKDLRVLYDTDFTGYKHSQLLKKQYKCTALTLPKLGLQTKKALPKPDENDLCDYIGKFGWDNDLEICLARRPFSKRGFVLPAIPQIKVQKYLGAHKDTITNFFLQHNRIQLAGDAGLGKTHTLLREVAPQMPKEVLFVVPYTIQVSQIEEEYKDLGHLLTCFHNKPPQEEEELRFSQINVCTYDRASQLFEKNPDMELWVDESHLLTLAYPYRRQAIDALLAMMQESSRVVLLSATPDFQFVRKEGYQLISFQRTNNPTFHISRFSYSSRQEKNALLSEVLQACSPKAFGENNGIAVVRLNDKKLALSCRDVLVEMGIYKAEEIDFVFSMEEKNFYTRSHAALVQSGLIPQEVKLLFVSSVFDCGINVYNKNIDKLILFETQTSDNSLDVAVQVSQRFRNLEKLEVVIVKKEWTTWLPDAQQAFFKRERQAQALAMLQLQTINTAHTKYQQKVQQNLERYKKPSYLKLNSDLSKPYQALHWNKNRHCFEINQAYLRCNNELFLQEHLGKEEFYALLEKELVVKWKEEEKREKADEQESAFCEKLKEAHTHRKKWLQKTTEDLLPQLEEQNQQAFFETLYAQSKDIRLKENILSQTPASMRHISEQQDSNPAPISTNIEGAMEVGAKHTIAKKYFQLKELLFSPAQAKTLLKANPKDQDFSLLLREIGNQIKLTACEKLGDDVMLLAQDTLLREEIQTLKLLRNELSHLPQATPKEQKSTAKLAQEAQKIGERLQ
jgi:hypothetical protein